MEPKQTGPTEPREGQQENTARQHEREDIPGPAPSGGIPPLPEPDVEGVGEESGPSAGEGSDELRPEQKKMAEDGTGF